MTIRTLLAAAALTALFALAACDHKPQEVTSISPDPNAGAIANAAPVELPPSIKADVTLRCKDNSLIYVTFFDGGKLAVVKTAKDGAPTKLTAANEGDPLTADGYSMTGTPKSITLTQPGKASQSCTA